MTTISRTHSKIDPRLLIAVAIALAIVATLPALRDIPMTNHAQDGHAGQLFTAETISARISSRSCKPIYSYSCTNQVVVFCPVSDPNDLYIGLFIGTATGSPNIVTGFAAKRSYWFKRVEGCLPTSYVP